MIQTFREYQDEAAMTISRADGRVMTDEDRLANFGLGLAGEAGEVADIIKKHLYHGKPMDMPALKKELGDVLWYWSAIATVLGLFTEDIAATNIRKLRARHNGGAFTGAYHEASARDQHETLHNETADPDA